MALLYVWQEVNEHVKIWDLPVRLFHWLLVITIAAAYITNSLGINYFKYHAWCGYAVIVLVVFRIVWGFVGTYHAKFSSFIRNPVTTFKYSISYFKRHSSHYAGHNPLGAVMVVIFLVTLFAQAVTGLFSNDEIFNVGPLYNYVSAELSLQLTSLHRQLFYWIMGAVVLHVLAVLIHVFFKRENIIKSMITGNKPRSFYSEVRPLKSSRVWLALLIIILVAAGLAWIIFQAPEPIMDVGYE
ncbi:MAG: cytochrome B [Chitinophagaceae bacterium]|nr:MAG: cytochrome B [Chitinophagaceae bacterium]